MEHKTIVFFQLSAWNPTMHQFFLTYTKRSEKMLSGGFEVSTGQCKINLQ
jgi:hypothetical protein